MMRKGSTNKNGTMNCWNLTYNDPGRWAEVFAISGKPYSFVQSIRVGGTGSPRGKLLALPASLNEMRFETSNIDYCNIQRTHDGGILYFKVRLEVYGIPIHRSHVKFIRSEIQDDQTGILLLQLNEGLIKIGTSFSNRVSWSRFLEKAFG